ncbi:hypothetical protein GCM10023149_33520 [Mucilaginibacter gynuensis]|uniref:Uncharacterized protein n=2 Tax=Mucilaginibacter gynuensis TaxID=1302236 RepID=A0ABP8GSB5_9SPHI
MLRHDRLKTSEGYVKSFNNKIVGQISELEASHSIIKIDLTNGDRYIFAQTTESYLKKDFIKNSYVGDSIFKKAFSNKIIIKHKDSIHLYTILKNDGPSKSLSGMSGNN